MVRREENQSDTIVITGEQKRKKREIEKKRNPTALLILQMRSRHLISHAAKRLIDYFSLMFTTRFCRSYLPFFPAIFRWSYFEKLLKVVS